MLPELIVPTLRSREELRRYFTRGEHLSKPVRTRRRECYKNVPCKFFASGKCHRGEQCMFSHDPTLQVADIEHPSTDEPTDTAKKCFVSPFQP